MSDQFLAEIRTFGFNFPPTGWAHCNGQLIPISQNTALFALLGTFYGGDGKSTFALPDLQGNVATHDGVGQGPGLSQWVVGEQRGSQTTTLLQSEIPAHSHSFSARPIAGNSDNPTNNVAASGSWVSGTQFGVVQQYTVNGPNTQMGFNALSITGGDQPHNNMMPTLMLNFCIALQGVFPAHP